MIRQSRKKPARIVVPGERRPKACLPCKRKHLSCDKNMPNCDSCVKRSFDCQWEFFGDATPSPSFVAINAT